MDLCRRIFYLYLLFQTHTGQIVRSLRHFRVKLTPSPSVTLGQVTNLRSRTPYRNYVTSLQPALPPHKGSELIIACRNKRCFSFLIPTSAVNVTLLTHFAECRAVTSVAAPLVVYAQRSASNPPHVGATVA